MLLLCHLTADSFSFILKKISDLVESWRFYNKLKMKDQTVHFRHILLFYFLRRRTRIKLVKSCIKFTVTMLYKNVSANNGSRNSVLVILISTTLLDQEGPPRLMTTK